MTADERLDILDLLARVNIAFDDADAAALRACFSENAEFVLSSRTLRPGPEMDEWVGASASRPPHRHLTTNHVLAGSAEPGAASSRSSWAYISSDGTGAPTISTG